MIISNLANGSLTYLWPVVGKLVFAWNQADEHTYTFNSSMHNTYSMSTKAAVTYIAALLNITVAAQLPYTSENAVPWHIARHYEIRQNLDISGTNMNLVSSGTNVIWDFTSIQLDPPYLDTVFYEPASVTPYQSTYPTSNIVVRDIEPSGSVNYQYFNNSPFELRLLGGVHVPAGGEPLFIGFCPSPFLIMDYPMSIGSGVQQVYNCPQAQNEIDSWVIMATGSIVYNGGSMHDLVMWRSVYAGPGYSDTSYFWTQYDNVLYHVARYRKNDVLRLRKPIMDEILNVTEHSLASVLEVFPNPASDRIELRATGAANGPLRAEIFDALGRSVQELGMIPITGTTTHMIGDLRAGTYLIDIRNLDGTPVQRSYFVKQ